MNPAHSIADPQPLSAPLYYHQPRGLVTGDGAITVLVDEITALTPVQYRKITRRKRAHFDRLRAVLDDAQGRGHVAGRGYHGSHLQPPRNDSLALSLVPARPCSLRNRLPRKSPRLL